MARRSLAVGALGSLVLLLGAAAFAGCGNSDDDDDGGPAGDAASGTHQDAGADAADATSSGGDAARDGSPGSDSGDATVPGDDSGSDAAADSSADGSGSGDDDSGGGTEAGSDGGTPDSGADSGPDAGPLSTIHYYGRFDTTDNGATPETPIFDWSGSGIVADFVGTGIAVTLTNYPYSQDGVNELQVVVDGNAGNVTGPGLQLLNGGACTVKKPSCTGTYVLADNLADGQHRVEIYKRTEALYGRIQFGGFSNTTDGSGDWALVATPDPYPRRLEFIGDSITAGFGVLGPNANCDDDGDYNDAYEAYSGDTAHMLGASYVAIAYSGKGVYEDLNGNTTQSDPSNPEMPAQYLRCVQNLDDSYDFATQVDAVVINLGTNDFAAHDADPGQPFLDAYIGLVATVRSKYPGAYILLLDGPLVTPYYPFTGAYAQLKSDLDVVVKHFTDMGDTQVADLQVGDEPDCQKYPDQCGCSDHPDVTEQATVATAVVAQLKSAKGW